MENKRIDWTQYVVSKVNENRPFAQQDAHDSEAFRTTDKIYLRSVEDVRHQTNAEIMRSPTDYALLTGSQQSHFKAPNGKIASTIAFRDYDAAFRLAGGGVFIADSVPSGTMDSLRMVARSNLSPSLTLRLPEDVNIGNISSEFVQIEAERSPEGRILYHTLKLGEYPQTLATPELQQKLDEMYNGGHLRDGLECTGRLFTTQKKYIDNIVGTEKVKDQLSTEFEYNGERYARVVPNFSVSNNTEFGDSTRHNRGIYSYWVKVEPIKFRIANYAEFQLGEADALELDSDESLVSISSLIEDVSYIPNCLWQNSAVRAYLNSSKLSELDGNPKYKVVNNIDFSKNGFLNEALDMTREPVREYVIPRSVLSVDMNDFDGCVGLEKIVIPPHVKEVDLYAFSGCTNAQIFIQSLRNTKPYLPRMVFGGKPYSSEAKFMYISKNGEDMILSPYEDVRLKNDYIQRDFDAKDNEQRLNLSSINYVPNIVQTVKWKDEGKIRFIPPDFTLRVFPSSQMQNYFVNNNQKRWGNLVKTLGVDKLEGLEKENSLTDLMKIYYAIGGFSQNQGESEKAYDYVLKYVATIRQPNATPSEIGAEIHQRFSRLEISDAYNPTFAKFFMKYYHKNPDFMRFDFSGGNGNEIDYLCKAHNSFAQILEDYPNHSVNGSLRNSLLSPELVAKSCAVVHYENVAEGNRLLAETVGTYGYSQSQFEHIQETYDKAKTIKNDYVITADKAKEGNDITFRVLKKDDPLGFVIGNITTCCQHIGGAGESCVDDGYTNPNAGFMVFEESVKDERGEATGKKRILGQAYIWYDPETRTVCYDNIEVPNNLLEGLRKTSKNGGKISTDALLDAVVESADAVMNAMNRNGVPVCRVTIGQGYNDLRKELDQRFGSPEKPPKAKHREYSGYSDANTAQYVIRTYAETTRNYSETIRNTAHAIQAYVSEIQNSVQSQSTTAEQGQEMER